MTYAPGQSVLYWAGDRKRRRVGTVEAVSACPPAYRLRKLIRRTWVAAQDVAGAAPMIPEEQPEPAKETARTVITPGHSFEFDI